MKRIRVPAGMLEAALKDWEPEGVSRFDVERAVENALRWLSEHPQVPTDEQMQKLWDDSAGCGPFQTAKYAAVEWQRRCFVEEELEIPAEIKDLIEDARSFPNHEIAGMIIDAYRRGLRKGAPPMNERSAGE